MPPASWKPSGPARFYRRRDNADRTPIVSALTPNADRVAGGASITITGNNFRYETSGAPPVVSIGGTAATGVVVVDALTITCVAPASATAGLVAVAVACEGQVGTLARCFTYSAGSVREVVPAFGLVGGGGAVVVNGYNFVTGSTIKFGGVAATAVAFIDDQHFSCVAPAHASGYVDVVITEPLGAVVTLRNAYHYTVLSRGTDIRRRPGITIKDALNNAPNTCTLTIDGTSNVPVGGEEMRVTDSADGDRLLFAGNVQSYDQEYEDSTSQIVWKVVLTDFTTMLNKYRPIGAFENVPATDVVKSILGDFAPGFTSVHVQTGLAKVTVYFNGEEDFATCLSRIAAAIGGGHWYVDYTRDVHFFHVTPAEIVQPDDPQTTLRLGPGTAMTVTQGAAYTAVANTKPSAFWIFRSTFVYSNGIESAMGPLCNPVAIEGPNLFSFAGVPIGAAIGALTCVKRRIYYRVLYNPNNGDVNLAAPPTGINFFGWNKFCEVGDNTTVAFTTFFNLAPRVMATPTVAPTAAEWPGTAGGIPPATDFQYVYTFARGVDYFDHSIEGSPSPASVVAQTTTGYLEVRVPHAVDEAGIRWVFLYRSPPGGGAPYKNVSFLVAAQYNSRQFYLDNHIADPGYSCSFVDYQPPGGLGIDAPPADSGVLTPIPTSAVMPLIATVAPPPAPPATPSMIIPADLYQNNAFSPQAPLVGKHVVVGHSMGGFKFLVSCLYRDGTLSLPCETDYVTIYDPTGAFYHDSSNNVIERFVTSALGMVGIPIGPPINGVDCIARVIYGHYLGRSSTDPRWTIPDLLYMWYLVPDNVTTSISDLANTTWGFDVPRAPSADPNRVVWPNPDGPSLEDDDPPDDINDSNVDLLHSDAGQGFTSSMDKSQLRNRIIVKGPATTLVKAVAIGDTTYTVADTAVFEGSGGFVMVNDRDRASYFGVSSGIVTNSNGKLYLSAPAPKAIPQGSVVRCYLQLDDLESQKALGRVEVDANGLPTDGVHEFVINDPSLATPFQRYVRGYAELELFSRPIVTVKYATRNPTRSGQTVHVDLTNPPCVGDFLVQDVTIDQIHDESDALLPRYTVTASSVRFELNDLLLQILTGNAGGSSGGSAGVVPAATGGGDAIPSFPRATNRIASWSSYDGTGVQRVGQQFNVAGVSAQLIDAAGIWRTFTAQAGGAGVDTTGGFCWWDHKPFFEIKFRTGPTVPAGSIFWIVISSPAPPNNSDNFRLGRYVGIRYSAGTDTGWVAATANGAAQTIGPGLAAINVNTEYTVSVGWKANNLAAVAVNGSTANVHVSNLTGIIMDVWMLLEHAGPTFPTWDFKSLYAERS